MLYHLSEFLLLRIPLNSIRNYQINNPGQILSDKTFLSAVYLASPDFYRNLEKKNFDPENLNDRERNSIRKYYNRSCFRATPFGLFSSISLIHWAEEKISFSNSAGAQDLALTPDRSFINRVGLEFTEGALAPFASFETNPILYRLGDEYRFVRSGFDETYEKRDYLLQSIAYSWVLKRLFDFCRKRKSKAQIIERIIQLAGCTDEEATAYFEFLADAQILLNMFRPSISGTGHLERLETALDQYTVQKHRPVNSGLFPGHDSDIQEITPDRLKAIADSLQPVSHIPGHTGQPVKLGGVFERKISGGLGSKWKRILTDGLFALDKLCPEPSNPAMEEFARNFEKRFEHQALPLLQALDTEIGIGYFLQPGDQGPLLETLDIHPPGRSGNSLNWTAAHSLLLNFWARPPGGGLASIHLEKHHLEKLESPGQDKGFLGSSVLFRVAGHQLFIESAGGVNSLALSGRFTPNHPAIYQAAKEIAEEQEAANPELIFAEILHLLNPHAENVALRENIWNWDIPLTAVSTLPEDRQIQLNDLFVTVKNDKVYLWSRKHKKIVIPRHTSAYNHQLNQLPLFRFLADLTYQYGRSSLSLKLSQFFPGLKFYPRVSYQESILHLATWVLDGLEIQLLLGDSPQRILSAFKQLDASRNFPDVFTLAEGDQQLTFSKLNEDEVLFFAECLKNKKEAIVQEFLSENEADCLVRNSDRQPFVNQFSVPLKPAGPLAIHVSPPAQFAVNRTQRKFVPGSEWLYLKIYSSRTASTMLLSRIYPLIQKEYGHGKLLKWFFIRYEDHAPHIRLRLRIHPKDTGEILAAFKTKLEDKINQQVIREYQVDVYSREIERYQGINYDLTENFFWASSELVYHWLSKKKGSPAGTSHLLAIKGLQDILEIFIPDKGGRATFALNLFEQFLAEFENAGMKRDLDRKYRGLNEQLRAALTGDFYRSHHLLKPGLNFKLSLQEIAGSLAAEIPYGYLSAIIHMHLNRIFTADSRKQEMIVYYLYYKFLQSETARNKP